MEVKDGLSCAGADVEYGPVSLLDVTLTSDLGRSQMTSSDYFGIVSLGFLQSGKMFLRHDKHMRGRLRADVFEGVDMIVFVNFLGGNLARDYAAEKAVCICHSESPMKNNNTGSEELSFAAAQLT